MIEYDRKMFYQVSIIIVIFTISGNGVVRPIGASADILAFFPLPIYSHFSGFNPLFMELVNRGHRITVVSPFYPKGDVPITYRHVSIPDVKIQSARSPMDIRHRYNRLINMINVRLGMMRLVTWILELNETRAFLNVTQYAFDLVLTECWYSDIYLAIGHRYSASVVCLSPMAPSVTVSQSLGVPDHPAYVPSFWLRYSDSTLFGERMYNAAIAAAEVAFRSTDQQMLDDLYTYPGHRNCPPLDTLRQAVQLTLVNGHHSVSYARPYPPNVVQVAGVHIRPPTSASVDRQKFKVLLDGATHGAIYFSFGSNIKMSDLGERDVQTFVESFRKLKQIVLWEWENGTIANMPDNVYIDKWFPQQYILSHKNCKLFITHGGYHSLVEVLHYGLPLIGFPFYTDQFYNMRFVIENGFGIEILLENLNVKVLVDAIGKIFSDISYKKNAQTAYSNIFLDLPVSAMDTAVHSVEHLIQNGVADYNLPTSTSMSRYQYFLIDIMVLIGAIVALTASILYEPIGYLWKIINLKDKKSK
ncbi:LOW QUALITY PROTEIN: UDP-glycosyltransferase UGT4-like [Metopolophium dirhodum]|uniref:LOW QUALITY PROTEIN: UDP-glycosyltransferase UGT4-like n=1 Tax=Metopolophium dirhodum TaxID=44670 RepID=UPI002990789E|nr:LOW QUALITY PROTEIN: UDP-glycosyltransferase UGT4-like [Metopolophium dirhodum]XP_060863325.1 LOW QUALITY PROTEIN: UDP-glycosyltransferase UGT4-like [Metopolophium dirhodum]